MLTSSWRVRAWLLLAVSGCGGTVAAPPETTPLAVEAEPPASIYDSFPQATGRPLVPDVATPPIDLRAEVQADAALLMGSGPVGLPVVAVSPDGSLAATFDEAGLCTAFDVATGSVLAARRIRHRGSSYTIATFDRSGTRLALGSDVLGLEALGIQVWDLALDRLVDVSPANPGGAAGPMAFSPDGSAMAYLWYGLDDADAIMVASAADGSQRLAAPVPSPYTYVVGWVDAERIVAVHDGSIRTLSASTGEPLAELLPPEGVKFDAGALRPDGALLVVHLDDGRLWFADARTLEKLEEPDPEEDEAPQRMEFSSDGAVLLVKAHSGTFVYSGRTGELLARHPFGGGSPRRVDFSGDGRAMAVMWQSEVEVGHAATGREFRTVHHEAGGNIAHIALDSVGRNLFVAHYDYLRIVPLGDDGEETFIRPSGVPATPSAMFVDAAGTSVVLTFGSLIARVNATGVLTAGPTSASGNLHRGAGGEFWWTYDQLVRLGSAPLRFDGFAKAAASNGSRLVVLENGAHVVDGTTGSRLSTLNLDESDATRCLANPDTCFDRVVMSDDGSLVALSTRTRLQTFDASTGRRLGLVEAPNLSGPAYPSPDGRFVLSMRRQHEGIVYDRRLRQLGRLAGLPDEQGPPFNVVFGLEGQRLVVQSRGFLDVVELPRTGRGRAVARRVQSETETREPVGLTPDGSALISADWRCVERIDLTTGAITARVPQSSPSFATDSDRTTVFACDHGRLLAHSLAPGVSTGPREISACGTPGPMAASADGSLLAVAELEGVRLVRVADGRSMLLTFMLDESGPNGIQAIVASAPDGRMELVSGSAEGIRRRLPGRLRDARFEPVELSEGVLAEFFGGP